MTRRLFYMRDDHTFLCLPNDVERAMTALHHEFVTRGETYGMLCTKTGPMAKVNLHAGNAWDWFALHARGWLCGALQPTDAEIEYASWGVGSGV
jgi:hypothetical protein